MARLLSATLIRAGTALLPAGAVRERYRQEFLAGLHVFDRRARLAFALGILLDAFALRAAVGGDDQYEYELHREDSRNVAANIIGGGFTAC